MTPREQDAIIAEWMGWELYKGIWFYDTPAGILSDTKPPPFSTDLTAMASALAVVKERGLIRQYLRQLWKLTSEGDGGDYDKSWYCHTAAAAQRAKALVRVIEAEAER